MINTKTVNNWLLEGLSCVNCAAQIEIEVNNLPGVSKASVDFFSRKLALETEEAINTPGIIAKIEKIVKRIEPGVRVVQEDSKEQGNAHGYRSEVNLKRQIGQLLMVEHYLLWVIFFSHG